MRLAFIRRNGQVCRHGAHGIGDLLRFGDRIEFLRAGVLDLTDHRGALAGHIKHLAPWVPVVLISGRAHHFHTDAPADLLLKRGAVPPAQLLESIRLLLVKRRGPRRSLPPADGESAAC